MELLGKIAGLNAIILSGAVTWYWMKGIFDTRSFYKAMLIIIALVFGVSLAEFLPSPDISNIDRSLTCISVEELWHNCGGWPFVSDIFYVVKKLSELPGTTYQIPASAAVFLGSWYIHTRLLTSYFEPKAILRSFFAGFLAYIAVIYLPYFQSAFNEILLSLLNFNGIISDGQTVLKSWLESLEVMVKVADESNSVLSSFLIVLTKIALYLPLFFIDVVNLILVLLQFLLMMFIPASLFLNSLSISSDPSYIFRLIGKFSLISVIQMIEWFCISLVPNMGIPDDLNNLSAMELFGQSIVFSLSLGTLLAIFGFLAFYFAIIPCITMIMSPKGAM